MMTANENENIMSKKIENKNYWTCIVGATDKSKLKGGADAPMRSAVLKLNHIVFWWYYKRVPNFFHQWTILKSIRLLKDNYEHALFREKGLNEVINGAIKREREMQSEISTMKLTMMGITQDKIDPINKMFGTDLKGKSTQARDN